MVFSDPIFVFFYLPTVLALYLVTPSRFRNLLIVLCGSIFYVWEGKQLIFLLLSTILVNYVAGEFVQPGRLSPKRSRRILKVTIAADILSLGFWKYFGFGINVIGDVVHLFGVHLRWQPEILLPIGISFFTFQCISYLVDVYRGTSLHAETATSFAAYILLFPHLIAGPIVRFSDIKSELDLPSSNRLIDLQLGLARFLWGLGKKVLIADQVAIISNRVFDLPLNELTYTSAWVGAGAYAIQIYYDFSGYSDMAIGLARVLGFQFKENFDRPYASVSITEFWRKWHISLSNWFRDYVYIPLGGNRRSNSRTYINLSLVFLLTGLWHGANLTFIFWGLYHGLLLIIERLVGYRASQFRQIQRLQGILTFVLVVIGWVFFRSESLGQAIHFLTTMFNFHGPSIPIRVRELLTSQRLTWMLIALMPILFGLRKSVGSMISERHTRHGICSRFLVFSLWGPLALIYCLSSEFSPFLYFKF